ncbi:MAG: LacI family transcriptional regulator, partial [Thermotogae bacterium]|nr:LacI family transcriptional regulator [Thermotogota bacterium]
IKRTDKVRNREAVLKAINALEYSPNVHARHLSTGKTKMISVILPTIGYEFQGRLINSIDSILSKYGFDSILFSLLSRDRLKRFSDPSHYLYHTDGLLVTSLSLSKMFFSNSLPTNKPYIMVDTFDDRNDCVHIDNYVGGKMVAQHLEIRNESSIFILGGFESDEMFSSHVFKDRIAGFIDGIKEKGIDISKVKHIPELLDWSKAYDVGVKIAKQVKRHFSVFSVSDILAWGFMSGCESAGKKVRENFSMIGYDDLNFTEKVGISTIHQPIEELGKIAAEKLATKILNGTHERVYVKITPTYIERSTN